MPILDYGTHIQLVAKLVAFIKCFLPRFVILRELDEGNVAGGFDGFFNFKNVVDEVQIRLGDETVPQKPVRLLESPIDGGRDLASEEDLVRTQLEMRASGQPIVMNAVADGHVKVPRVALREVEILIHSNDA